MEPTTFMTGSPADPAFTDGVADFMECAFLCDTLNECDFAYFNSTIGRCYFINDRGPVARIFSSDSTLYNKRCGI